MFKEIIKSKIHVPFINFYLSKRIVKFEKRIAFTGKTKLFRNVSVTVT